MEQPTRPKPTFKKRSVSLRTDQWARLERYAHEDAKHGMVSRALQDAVDAWEPDGERTETVDQREGVAA